METTLRLSQDSYEAEHDLRRLLADEAAVQGHEHKHDPKQETGIMMPNLLDALLGDLKSMTSEVGDWYSTSTTNRLKAHQK